MALSFCIDITPEEKRQLLEIAQQSIDSGLNGAEVPRVDSSQLGGNLNNKLASFVTLTQDNELRGCMGSLQATEALAQSVANTAYNAAFRDPRFPNLTAAELPITDIEISILSPMEPFPVASREDLLNQLEPNVDGLLLEDGHHRATFLPQVWDKTGRPEEFLRHLLAKAGLPADHWSERIRFSRYQTLSFHE